MEEFESEHTVDGKISPGARALIMGTCEAEGVVMLIGSYLRKYGVLDHRAVKRGSLELSPLLSRSWLAYQNTIRQNVLALEALKNSRGQHAEGPTLEAIRAEYEVQAEAVAGQDAPGSAQGPRSEAEQELDQVGQEDAPVADEGEKHDRAD
jgi:hypothetical protein